MCLCQTHQQMTRPSASPSRSAGRRTRGCASSKRSTCLRRRSGLLIRRPAHRSRLPGRMSAGGLGKSLRIRARIAEHPGVSVEVHEAGIESPAELAARLAFSADLAIVGGWSGFAKADPAGVALFNALLLTREGPLWWCRRIGGQATTRVRLWVGKTPQTHAAPCTARSHCYSRCRLSFWWRYAAIRTRWRVLLALSQLPSLNTSGAGASPHRPPGCLPDTAVPARSCSITPARPRRR